MAILRTITFCVIAAASSHALAGACTTPVLGALAHEPDGVYVIRKTTPDNIAAQCGSAIDACIIHKGGTDLILIRNDLSSAEYQCALLHQYAVINAKQI